MQKAWIITRFASVPIMSLCYRVKQLWRGFFFGDLRRSTGENWNETSTKENSFPSEKPRGLTASKSQYTSESSDEAATTENGLVSYGIEFSSHEEMHGFDSKMVEMRRIFEEEVDQIRLQHQRLRAGRIILRRRFTEMENILKTEISNLSASKLKTLKENAHLSSQDRQLIEELEEILEQLEKENDELSFLMKYLEIEIKERTLYPEPIMPKSKCLEDDFSKQMRLAGGLSYESSDKSIQFMTYQCLPPPLSLSELLSINSRETTATISRETLS